MMSIQVSPRLPVTILTGFLGAGKSTLLNFVLRHPQMTGTAVVINEYGAVGLDHHLIESSIEDTELIADGCLCCSARGRLADALLALLVRGSGRAGFYLRRVVIETTGLAEPSPILQELLRDPRLSGHFVLDSVVTVVDAAHAEDTLAHHDLAVQQVTAADHLIVSKPDMVDAAQLDALCTHLREMNPDAVLSAVKHGAAQPTHLFPGGATRPGAGTYRPGAWLANADAIRLVPATLVDRGLLQLRPDVIPPSAQDIQTFSLILDAPLPEWKFLGWMDFLRALCGPSLLRLKGLVHIEGQDGPAVIHGVQRAFHPVVTLACWPDADRRTRLVFITRGWGQAVAASTLAYLQAPPPATVEELATCPPVASHD